MWRRARGRLLAWPGRELCLLGAWAAASSVRRPCGRPLGSSRPGSTAAAAAASHCLGDPSQPCCSPPSLARAGLCGPHAPRHRAHGRARALALQCWSVWFWSTAPALNARGAAAAHGTCKHLQGLLQGRRGRAAANAGEGRPPPADHSNNRTTRVHRTTTKQEFDGRQREFSARGSGWGRRASVCSELGGRGGESSLAGLRCTQGQGQCHEMFVRRRRSRPRR